MKRYRKDVNTLPNLRSKQNPNLPMQQLPITTIAMNQKCPSSLDGLFA